MKALFGVTVLVSGSTCDLRGFQCFHLPDSAETSDPSPRRVVCNELAPEHGRAERNDGQNQSCHVLATLTGGGKLRCDSQCGEFVDSSTHTSERHATDKYVHVVCSAADDHTNNDERCSADRHPAATNNVRNAASERAHTGLHDGQYSVQVCQIEARNNEPMRASWPE